MIVFKAHSDHLINNQIGMSQNKNILKIIVTVCQVAFQNFPSISQLERVLFSVLANSRNVILKFLL